MGKIVVLTAISEADLEKITDYLMDNWGMKVCEKFLTRFEKVCQIISDSPGIYPLIYKKGKIRKCILTPQNTIYYREHKDRIEVITIFDSRQNPDKLQKLMKDL